MKCVILAGGFGTRISEESHLKPKPMIEIGGQPILWHIMKMYSAFGVNEFIICAGYMQTCIKDYFANYYLHHSDVTFDFKDSGNVTVHSNVSEPWKVTVVDTGLNTMTGGRIGNVRSYLGDEPFLMTYGDGVSDVDIHALIAFHKAHGKLATLTAVQPNVRFGMLDISANSEIHAFREKEIEDAGWINAGFMVLQPEIFDYIEGPATVFEREPLMRLASEGQLMAYQHKGFWQCMDTLREKNQLEELLASGTAPWVKW
ncbi:MAG: glucose-1-phosphate cytidylyltransferase [Oscillospiraceae bacterium]|jgi:glucose-1-phosphate cytidylyltransferase|nr:glucose-1-phosphate cytidylyltransferase [Oscillospiraceae bacterium]